MSRVTRDSQPEECCTGILKPKISLSQCQYLSNPLSTIKYIFLTKQKNTLLWAAKDVPVEVVGGGVELKWNVVTVVGDVELGHSWINLWSVPLGPQVATIHHPVPSVVL